ncbi:MAG: sigma-54-dependent transcriptional regulator [Myxococcota bacterium]
MTCEGRILVVDDEPNMRRVLGALLRRDGFEVIDACNGEQALERLAETRVHAVIADLRMPVMNGLELLESMQARYRGVPVVLLTAHGTVGSAVEALKHGALDYLTKPFDPEELRSVAARAVRTCRLDSLEASAFAEDPEELLIGRSDALREVLQRIERVAPTRATVLISGESGTGKELVARSLHRRSPRSEAPFIKINCAAIPEALLESELFGHERGAFTGARARKPGRFELADGGTLFLDEIGEMPLCAQPKLLRALQEGRFYRVGGTRTVTVDVRMVAASNRELPLEVDAGRFRADLFYRLNVVPIQLPPLRERPEDIPTLAARFLEACGSHRDEALEGFSEHALECLAAHPWPGNIRELENVVERACLLAPGPVIRAEDLPPELSRAPAPTGELPLRERVRRETRRIERAAIRSALRATGGNVTQAAKRLGLSRRGLQLKIKDLDLSA